MPALRIKRSKSGQSLANANLHELHGNQFVTLLLEPLDDLAHNAAVDAVRLDPDEGALLVGHGCYAVCKSRECNAVASFSRSGPNKYKILPKNNKVLLGVDTSHFQDHSNG